MLSHPVIKLSALGLMNVRVNRLVNAPAVKKEPAAKKATAKKPVAKKAASKKEE